MPSVINVEWPEEWTKFLKYFNFVNIDVMSLIGAKCVSVFNYYLSFTIMVCLPAGILIMAVLNYYFSIGLMTRKLSKMTEIQKKTKKKEALHALFELTDADQSGDVDPMELAEILLSLGWSIKLEEARKIAATIGAHSDEEERHGQLILDEKQFVDSIINGTLAVEMKKLNIKSNSNNLTDSDQLVKWILKSNLISNSLSGATQLLLLAHTPVSRKGKYCKRMIDVTILYNENGSRTNISYSFSFSFSFSSSLSSCVSVLIFSLP